MWINYHLQSQKVCAKLQMSYILTNVQVTVATSDVQRFLEIPVTDEIHMEGRNHGLDQAEQRHIQRLACLQLHLNHAVTSSFKNISSIR